MYETNDTPLAAFLVYSGFAVSEYKWSGKNCFMCFPDSASLQVAIGLMNRGEAKVNPREYQRTMSVIKAEMHSRRDFSAR